MISKLHLVNCQSHKDSLLKFHPGLNVIVGDTDSGKSAIIRGLDKVCFNSMPSKELVSHWGGPLSISLNVEGNLIVLKNDGKDSYKLNDILFNSIGNKVPEEISSILNLSDINIQNQIDSFFLLNETSGYVATYLNQIANLSQIDSTTKAIKSELNETKRTIEHDKKGLEEKEKALIVYSFLPNLETAIKETEKLEEKVESIEFSIKVLDSMLAELTAIDAAILSNKRILDLKPVINICLTLFGEIKRTEQELFDLETLIISLQGIESSITELNKLANLKPLINEALKVQDKQNDFKAKLERLDALMYKLSTIDKSLKTAISNCARERSVYDSEIAKLEVCFFCGSKLNKNGKENDIH